MNPLLVLAKALDKANTYLGQISLNTRPVIQHVYVIEETLQGWGVYCMACSFEKGDYVWPCKQQDPSKLHPPQFLKIAEEPPPEKKAF